MRERTTMVAGRRRHQGRPRRAIGIAIAQPQHRVARAADLVGERRLQGFELETDVTAGQLGQPCGTAQRRVQDATGDAFSGRPDLVERDQVGPVPPAMRISASCAAKADRAMT